MWPGPRAVACRAGRVARQGLRALFPGSAPSNEAAIALYASEGFVLAGVRKSYYPPRQPQAQSEDALLYSLTL